MAEILPPSRTSVFGRAPDSRDAIAKMEQKRQAQLCLRTIDLRGQRPGRCREYSYQGRTHFLDEASQAIFEAAIKEFGGHYTIGVYERVTEPDKAQQGAAKQTPIDIEKLVEEKESGMHLIQFGYRPHRAESRLNYVSGITLILENGERLAGKTLDLSLLGLRLQIPLNSSVPVGTLFDISFDELESRTHTKFEPIAYSVVGIDLEADRQILRVKRRMRATERDFDRFIPHFIQTMSARYKMELKDALQSVYARIYEQMYCPSIQYLHGFYALRENKVEHLFVTGNIHYAYLESPPMASWVAKQLARLVSVADVQAIDTHPVSSPQRLLAMRVDGRLFVLPSEALQDKAQREQWLQCNRAASETGAFAMIWRKQPKIDDSLRDQALNLMPDSVDEETQHWRERVAACTHSCALIAVSSLLIAMPEPASGKCILPNWLLPYEVATAMPPLITGMGLRGARSKERYLYSTRIILRTDERTESHPEPEAFAGESIDFSIHGLKLRLETPLHLKNRDVVSISFPALMAKIKDPSELEHQLYRVIRVQDDGQVVSLERDFRVFAHSAARFFAQLIQNNLHRLPPCPAEQIATTEAQLSEQMLAFGLLSIPLFLARDADKRPHILGIGHNATTSLLRPFIRDAQLQWQSLNQRDLLHDILHDCTNNIGYIDRVRRFELIWLRGEKAGTDKWFVFDQRVSPERRLKLLKDGLPSGRVFVFAAHAMPHPEVDRATLEQELQPIMRNSRHKADVFRNELSRMTGLVELLDITPSLIKELKLLGEIAG